MINSLLQPFQHFGVHLGLERIKHLLDQLNNPHHRVPIIHVAGTNGKGSVCAYLSSILTEAGYKVGRYTSPHLADWTERICINGQPIPVSALEGIIAEITAVIENPPQPPFIRGEKNTPLVNEKNTPLVNEKNTPLVNEKNTPLVNEKNTPLVNEKNTPLVNEKNTPLVNEKNTPLVNEKNAPLVKGGSRGDPEESRESPTQFEVITAAAYLYFAREEVDLAVMEVGLGGRLDATNVCHNPLVTVITSLSREHWQRLGPTLSDIAREKAGILKPDCPAVIGVLPPDAKAVVTARIAELHCPTVWVEPATRIPGQERQAAYGGIEYSLPLLGDVQLINSALAIAAIQLLQQQGWHIPDIAISSGMARTSWPGRIQWTRWGDRPLLIDGAHNPAAAQVLARYVRSLGTEVTWVMGILATKDWQDIFKALLRKGDKLYLVPIPDHSTADPEELAKIARNICPDLAACATFPDLFVALEAAMNGKEQPVLCGSLYLLGYFLNHRSN